MKTSMITVVCLILSACGGSTARNIDLDALAAQHEDAWNHHDDAAMANLFAADGTLVTPQGTRIEGHEELVAMLAQPSPTNDTTSSMRFTDVQWLTDDLVVIDGVQTLEGPGVEQIGASQARLVAVARREGDRWRLVAARPYVPAQLGGR